MLWSYGVSDSEVVDSVEIDSNATYYFLSPSSGTYRIKVRCVGFFGDAECYPLVSCAPKKYFGWNLGGRFNYRGYGELGKNSKILCETGWCDYGC